MENKLINKVLNRRLFGKVDGCQTLCGCGSLLLGHLWKGKKQGGKKFKSILGQVVSCSFKCVLYLPLLCFIVEVWVMATGRSTELRSGIQNGSCSTFSYTTFKFFSLWDLLFVVYRLCFPLFYYSRFIFCKDNVPQSQTQKEAGDRQAAFYHLEGITVIC